MEVLNDVKLNISFEKFEILQKIGYQYFKLLFYKKGNKPMKHFHKKSPCR